MSADVVVQNQHGYVLDLGQPTIVGDECCRASKERCSDLRGIRDKDTVSSPKVSGAACQSDIHWQHLDLPGMQQCTFIGLHQVLTTLALGVDQNLDECDDRGDSLNVRLSQVTKQRFRQRKVTSMTLPEVDKGGGIDAQNRVCGEVAL